MSSDRQVGEVIRVEWDEEEDVVRIVIEVTDPDFKNKVIHNRNFRDILTLRGKDAVILEEEAGQD